MHIRIPRQKRATVPVPAVAGSTDEKISDLLRSCAVSHVVQPEAARAALWQALWELARRRQRVSTSPEDPVFSLQNYVAQYLAEPISLPALARHVGLSTNQLKRIFKARIGETVASYWRTRRIENAAGLLRHTSLSIKAAAIVRLYRPSAIQQSGPLPLRPCASEIRDAETPGSITMTFICLWASDTKGGCEQRFVFNRRLTKAPTSPGQ